MSWLDRLKTGLTRSTGKLGDSLAGLATGTLPGAGDIQDLVALHEAALDEYKHDEKLTKPFGGSPGKAALAVVANAILNLDSVLTK